MAEKIVRQLVDDVDGSDITNGCGETNGGGERLEFSVRGVNYQIDLTTANVAKLDKALRPLDAAVKVGSARRRRAKAGNNGKPFP